MTISLKHTTQSTKPASARANDIDGPIWNEEHTITMASGNILGRTTAGTGAVEEIPFATIVGNGGLFQSRAAVALATVDADVDALRTLGYATPGDGGGALYKRVGSEPSHAGKVQSADGAWWGLAETTVNVKMFGAVGDGTTDDSTAIQAAFTFAQNSPNSIRFPAGVFVIGATITCTTTSPLSVLGAGIGVTRLRFTDCNGFTISQSGVTFREGCTIADMTLETSVNGTRTAITYTGKSGPSLGKQLVIRHVSFDGQTNALAWQYGVVATEADFGEISGCFFTGNTSDETQMLAAVRLIDTTDFHVTRSSAYWVTDAVQVVTSASISEGITVSYNHFAAVNRGVVMTGTGNLIWVVNNHIEADARGVVIGATGVSGVNHSHVAGNLIFKQSASISDFIAIECFGSKPSICNNEVLIPGGSSAGGTEKGIYIDGLADYARVVGNQIANMDTGIELASGTLYPQVIGNTFLSNTTNLVDSGSTARTLIDGHHGIVFGGFTAAAIADVTNGVNTTDKFAGKVVRDVTNDRLMMADGVAAASPWRSVDGGVTVNPV